MLPQEKLNGLCEELQSFFEPKLAQSFVNSVVDMHDKMQVFRKHNRLEILEDSVVSVGNQLCLSVRQSAVESLDGKEAYCHHDGQQYRREKASYKRVMTSFGALKYQRSRYRRRKLPSLFPVDIKLGLIENFWTPRGARIARRHRAHMPPQYCLRVLRDQDIMQPGIASLVRLYEAFGPRWQLISDEAFAHIREHEHLDETTAIVSIQLDGIMVPMTAKALPTGDNRKTA